MLPTTVVERRVWQQWMVPKKLLMPLCDHRFVPEKNCLSDGKPGRRISRIIFFRISPNDSRQTLAINTRSRMRQPRRIQKAAFIHQCNPELVSTTACEGE